jgi:hypothetical protein
VISIVLEGDGMSAKETRGTDDEQLLAYELCHGARMADLVMWLLGHRNRAGVRADSPDAAGLRLAVRHRESVATGDLLIGDRDMAEVVVCEYLGLDHDAVHRARDARVASARVSAPAGEDPCWARDRCPVGVGVER